MICAVEEISIPGFQKQIGNQKDWFTPNELKENLKRAKPAEALAARLALKRALLKALRRAGVPLCPLNQIEIIKDRNGAPRFRLRDARYRSVFKKSVATASVSLSHTHCTGIALAALELRRTGLRREARR